MGWSSWQDGEIELLNAAIVNATDGKVHTLNRARRSVTGTNDVIRAVFTAFQGDIAAGTYDSSGDGASSNPLTLTDGDAFKQISAPGVQGTTVDLRLSTSSVGFDATGISPPDLDYMPPALLALREGIDYGVRPDRTPGDLDAYVQYDPSGVTLDHGWNDWTTCLFSRAAGSDEPNGVWSPAELPITLDFAVLPALLPSQLDQWRGLDEGVTLLRYVVAFPAPFNTSPAEHDAEFHPVVPLASAGLAKTFALLFRSTNIDPANPVPGFDLTMPPFSGLTDFNYATDTTLVIAVDPFFALPAPSLPQRRWQLPRWRYWIPVSSEAPLRLAQRDDGLALSAHPRLPVGKGPTSTQLGATPRIGESKTYS